MYIYISDSIYLSVFEKCVIKHQLVERLKCLQKKYLFKIYKNSDLSLKACLRTIFFMINILVFCFKYWKNMLLLLGFNKLFIGLKTFFFV